MKRYLLSAWVIASASLLRIGAGHAEEIPWDGPAVQADMDEGQARSSIASGHTPVRTGTRQYSPPVGWHFVLEKLTWVEEQHSCNNTQRNIGGVDSSGSTRDRIVVVVAARPRDVNAIAHCTTRYHPEGMIAK